MMIDDKDIKIEESDVNEKLKESNDLKISDEHQEIDLDITKAKNTEEEEVRFDAEMFRQVTSDIVFLGFVVAVGIYLDEDTEKTRMVTIILLAVLGFSVATVYVFFRDVNASRLNEITFVSIVPNKLLDAIAVQDAKLETIWDKYTANQLMLGKVNKSNSAIIVLSSLYKLRLSVLTLFLTGSSINAALLSLLVIENDLTLRIGFITISCLYTLLSMFYYYRCYRETLINSKQSPKNN